MHLEHPSSHSPYDEAKGRKGEVWRKKDPVDGWRVVRGPRIEAIVQCSHWRKCWWVEGCLRETGVLSQQQNAEWCHDVQVAGGGGWKAGKGGSHGGVKQVLLLLSMCRNAPPDSSTRLPLFPTRSLSFGGTLKCLILDSRILYLAPDSHVPKTAESFHFPISHRFFNRAPNQVVLSWQHFLYRSTCVVALFTSNNLSKQDVKYAVFMGLTTDGYSTEVLTISSTRSQIQSPFNPLSPIFVIKQAGYCLRKSASARS